MTERRRLCEVKDELINISLKIARESRAVPHWRFALDDLKCPRGRGHCDPSKPCEAWRDREIRQTVAKIEDEIFVRGFVRADSNDIENYRKEQQR